jgi:nitroreductase
MTTLSPLSTSLISHLKPDRVKERSGAVLELPPPRVAGVPLMELLARRQSQRDFSPTPLPMELLSDLLWAAFGINRPDTGRRTAPSAMNAQEIDVYVAMAGGTYVLDAKPHRLHRVVEVDARRRAGYQDFIDDATVDLIYVADTAHTREMPIAEQEIYAPISVGAIAQNVYLFCAAQGLSTVLRGWFDRVALGRALTLGIHEKVLLTQTVGYAVE